MSQEIRQKITHYERELRRLRKQLRKSKGLGPKKKGQGCRDRDEALKAEREYKDPSTRVRSDGSEKLAGVDWTKRKQELAERSGGRCEFFNSVFEEGEIVFTFRCHSPAEDADHKIKRSTRRDDRLSNLQHLCRYHHNLKHAAERGSAKRTFAVKPAPESEQQPI